MMNPYIQVLSGFRKVYKAHFNEACQHKDTYTGAFNAKSRKLKIFEPKKFIIHHSSFIIHHSFLETLAHQMDRLGISPLVAGQRAGLRFLYLVCAAGEASVLFYQRESGNSFGRGDGRIEK